MRNPFPKEKIMTKARAATPRRTTAKSPAKQSKAGKSQPPKRKPRQPRLQKEQLVWEGLTLAISYAPKASFSGHAHLQVQVTAPERDAPLPITDTGYRSHFLLRGIVEEVGGPSAYVRAWLDEAAGNPKWKRVRDRWRQRDLFA
jgi:hypothetical protein